MKYIIDNLVNVAIVLHLYYRDMVIVTLGDCLTSFFAGFVIFAVLGYMANEQGVPVPDVVKSGWWQG